ncbi:MAG: substrate-binding domain-containing protein [Pararhodobacter sp.]
MNRNCRTLGLASGFALMLTLPAVAEVRIGVLVPDSGPAGLFGPSARNVAQLALEDINAAGGINGEPVRLIFADAGVPPAQAVQSVVRLWRGEGVHGFVGMHDSAVRAALVGQFRGQIPYIYTPVYEGGECAPGTWVTGETPAQQLAPVLPWLAENEGATQWYLIANDYNWGRGTSAAAREIIEDFGGAVVGEEFVPLGTSDFDASLQRIRGSGANAVLVSLVGGDSVAFNIGYGAFGLDDRALRLGTLIEENTLAGIGAAGSNRLYAAAGYFGNIETEAAQAFAARYHESFGADAAPLNTLGQSVYDGLLLMAALGNAAGSMDAAAIAEVADGTGISTPRGEVLLAGNHVAQNVYLADGTGGSFSVVASFDAVSAGVACE